MIFLLLLYSLFSMSLLCTEIKQKSAVTYVLNGGRFGDNLKSFIQSYAVAYQYELPFLYVPFEGSDALCMHIMLPHATSDMIAAYNKKIIFDKNNKVIINNVYDTLYMTTFYAHIEIPWENQEFKNNLRTFISPIEDCAIPHDITESIAIHVRRGGGFHVDTNRVKKNRPGHFPDITYYAHALDWLLTSINEPCINVYIFTDDTDPSMIAEEIVKHLKNHGALCIKIWCRQTMNSHDQNVLEDFFALQHARYLIRPKSNFSLYAQHLGNHTIVIHPARVKRGNPWGIVESMMVDCGDTKKEILLM